MKHQQGFSLIELMMAIVIISIITAVALPSYRDYITRGRIPEATAGLGDTRVRMEQFYQDNRSYPVDGCAVAPTAPTATQIPVAAGNSFDLTCAATATTFTVTATGKGPMAGFAYAVNQLNNQTSAITGVPLGQGWKARTPNNCWVTKKGGYC